MSNYLNLSAVREVTLGQLVTYDPGSLPASGSTAIFAVNTGRVVLTSLVGNVTTAVQNQACTLSLGFSPLTGTASGTSIAGTFSIANLAVGSQVGPSTTAANGATVGLLQSSSGPAYGLALCANPIVLQPGSIYEVTSATNTGDIAWACTYVPLDNGANVTAG